MERLQYPLSHEWHVAVNKHSDEWRKAGDYSQRLRSHLIEFIYPPEVAAAPSAPQQKGDAA